MSSTESLVAGKRWTLWISDNCISRYDIIVHTMTKIKNVRLCSFKKSVIYLVNPVYWFYPIFNANLCLM